MTSQTVVPRPGMVVEFLQGNQPQLAWVMEEQSGRLRLFTINKREMKMPANRVLPWAGPVHNADATRQEMLDALNAHQERRGELQAGLDVMELWELAQGEVEQAPVGWFAGLLWEKPGPDEAAALGRAMLSAKTHFKFQPPVFEVYTAETVEERLRRQAEEKERDAVVHAGQTLFKGLWAAVRGGGASRRHSEDAERDMEPDVAARLREVLLAAVARNLDDAADKIWQTVRKGLPDDPHLPLLLAQAWGVLPPHHNQILDEAGYDWGDDWSEKFVDEIAEQRARFERMRAEATEGGALDPRPFVSIDAATTKDIDDAFHVERDGSGYRLTLALARPSMAWDFGAPLDRAVASRATSLYLPEGSAHMMPESLGTGLFSLHADGPRPVLLTMFQLDDCGCLLSVHPALGWARMAANITYEAAEAAMADGSDPHLALAAELGEKLLAKRIENGAVIIDKPEPEVTLEGSGAAVKVLLDFKTTCPRAETAVSEFMILANSGLALWARENGVPLLHRTQDIALPSEATGRFSDPADICRTVKLLTPPQMEIEPKRHAALAVPAYAPISSPLRRYTDFINTAQVQSFLETGEPRLDADQMSTLLTHLGARVQSVSQVQRFRPRYWKLLYLLQHKKEYHSATVVEENGPYPGLALPELQINIRAPRAMLGEKLFPGQRFQVRFGRIDPLSNEIKVIEALEE